MKLMIGLAALLLVSACSTHSPIAAPAQDSAASTCLAGGGTMRQVGKLQSWKCITPYRDAGKACTDSSQWEGECQTSVTTQSGNGPVAGTCQVDNSHFGCSATVEKGKLGRAICVDWWAPPKQTRSGLAREGEVSVTGCVADPPHSRASPLPQF